jgi:hypothetical protein
MLAKFYYYLVTAVEALFSVFGIRSFYEQPRYMVVDRLSDELEIRSYDRRLAVETTVESADIHAAESEAFRLLLAYIAGANRGRARFPMTAPVEQSSQPSLIAMTAPVEITRNRSSQVRMRFFLPTALAAKGAPEPIDDRVKIVKLAPVTLAVLRFAGGLSQNVEVKRTEELINRVARSGWRVAGTPFLQAYDPPFTIPFLRRNEIAVPVTRD